MKINSQGDHLCPRSFYSASFYPGKLHFLEKSCLKKSLHFVKTHLDDFTLETATFTLFLSSLSILSFIGFLGVGNCWSVGLLHVNNYISHNNKYV